MRASNDTAGEGDFEGHATPYRRNPTAEFRGIYRNFTALAAGEPAARGVAAEGSGVAINFRNRSWRDQSGCEGSNQRYELVIVLGEAQRNSVGREGNQFAEYHHAPKMCLPAVM